MYRDFQENTINSDGSFGMWIVVIAAIYLGHEIYNYFLPWYWNKTAPCKNGEEQRVRMRDALASTLVEETTGMQFAEWGWTPHDYHSIRRRVAEGLSHPDDVRAMAVSTMNRRHRYVEHYRKHIGDDQTRMIAP
jgi:hypothetical protein